MLNTEALSHDVRAEQFGRGKCLLFSDLKIKINLLYFFVRLKNLANFLKLIII